MLPVRASCCESPRAIRSDSKARLRASAARVACDDAATELEIVAVNGRCSPKKTTTSPRPSPSTGTASSASNGTPRQTPSKRASSRRARPRRPAVGCRLRQRRGHVEAAQLLRELVRTADARRPPSAINTARERAAERLTRARAAASSVSALRERLREERRDLRERPLGSRLLGPFGEALRVAKRERRESREGLQQVGVVLHERPPPAARIPTPSTPRTSPPHTIGATSACANPRYASCGTCCSSSS
jgi:hypothetical protein